MGKYPRHFSEIDERELDMLIERCQQAAIDYCKERLVGGLSDGAGAWRSHNLYVAIEDAVRGEYRRAVQRRRALKLIDSQRGRYCDICALTLEGGHPTATVVLAAAAFMMPILFAHKECLAANSDIDDLYAGSYGGAWATRRACLASLHRLRSDVKLGGEDQAAIDRYERWCRTAW